MDYYEGNEGESQPGEVRIRRGSDEWIRCARDSTALSPRWLARKALAYVRGWGVKDYGEGDFAKLKSPTDYKKSENCRRPKG